MRPRWRLSNRCWPIDTNQYLARQIETLGGRAMNLNFQTTNVLFGQRIELEGDDGQPGRSGLRRDGDARRPDGDRQPVLCRSGPGDSVDVHR